MPKKSEVEPSSPNSEPVNRMEASEPAREPDQINSLFEGAPKVASVPKMPSPEELWVDPEKLATGTTVKKIITVIPLRRPEVHEFFRIHPDPVWERPLVLLENKLENQNAIYVVAPGLVNDLQTYGVKYRMAYLFPTMTLQQAFFLMPVSVPGWDGRKSDWSTTAYDAAQNAKTKWTKRMAGNGMYLLFEAEDLHPEPKWLDNMSPTYIYGIAFRDGRIIDHIEHPVIKKLRGATVVE